MKLLKPHPDAAVGTIGLITIKDNALNSAGFAYAYLLADKKIRLIRFNLLAGRGFTPFQLIDQIFIHKLQEFIRDQRRNT